MGSVKDMDGTTTNTDSERILMRWRPHFESLLNDHMNTLDDLLYMTPQYPIRHGMSLPISTQDLNKAINHIKPGNTPGPDNIPLEFLTHCGPELKKHLMLLILKIWETKTFADDFRDANIITIFKKGDQENCNKYHEISPLGIASKIFAHILLDRLLVLAEDVLPESHCGFQPS